MRRRKALTVLELLVVVLILGALAAIVLPRLVGASQSAKAKTCKTNIDTINQQIELYHLLTGSWPNNLKDVTENIDYFPDGPPECPFGEKYKLNKEHGKYRVRPHNH